MQYRKDKFNSASGEQNIPRMSNIGPYQRSAGSPSNEWKYSAALRKKHNPY